LKRAAVDRRRALRVAKAWQRRSNGGDAGLAISQQIGRFRKGRRIGGCGNAHCQVCHFSKIHGYPTLHEEKAWLAYRDQLEEAGISTLERHQRRRARGE